MPRMTGGQALVRQLRAEGVDTVFGLPGVQIMAAFDALHELQNEIRLIHTRHEQATTYMADGYARVSGKPGVAMVVPGPGALNASAGLGTAYASSSPVLLISGQIASGALGKRQGQLHEVDDQLDVFRPITKWVRRVTKVEEVPESVHEAFRRLKTGRPRPVELEIPHDVLSAAGDVEVLGPEDYPRAAGRAVDIRRAVQLLATCQRPVIIAGGGAILSGASEEILELAELLQARVITTPQGKGIIPEDHYLHVGVNYYIEAVSRVLPESDLLLAIGTRLLMRAVKPEHVPKVVHIEVDAAEIGKNLPTEVGIHADAKAALGQLLRQLRALTSPRESRRAECDGDKKAFKAEVEALAPRQVRIADTLRRALDDDAIVVSGITNIGYWSHLAYTARQPRTYVTSSYFGSLGYAFPTGLGAKVAQPDRQVVALCGDGGFMYCPQELSTAVRYGINLVAIVFNNQAYGASRWDQAHRYGQRFIGTDLHNPDFVKLAEAFGAVGIKTDAEGLGDALKEALTANAPTLLEVALPNLMPPFQIIR